MTEKIPERPAFNISHSTIQLSFYSRLRLRNRNRTPLIWNYLHTQNTGEIGVKAEEVRTLISIVHAHLKQSFVDNVENTG